MKESVSGREGGVDPTRFRYKRTKEVIETMEIVFRNAQRQIVWNLPMIEPDDERAIISWASRNRVHAESINGAAQLARAVLGILDQSR